MEGSNEGTQVVLTANERLVPNDTGSSTPGSLTLYFESVLILQHFFTPA